jgi:hypothetical protein
MGVPVPSRNSYQSGQRLKALRAPRCKITGHRVRRMARFPAHSVHDATSVGVHPKVVSDILEHKKVNLAMGRLRQNGAG